MVAVVKTFIYSGLLNKLTIPPGTTSIDVHLWGGAGGGGGSDAGGSGGTGAAGHHVSSSTVSISSSQIGTVMQVAVGGGGAGGTSGTSAAGGTNGKSITDYSGGQGGAAGPRGNSGSGGGGGGATVVQIDGTDIAVAGGGGGGAGAGAGSNGTSGINSNSATSRSPGTLGEDGAGHSGDGAGGGAGGGGVDGGIGGNGGSNDNGGTGGRSGSNNAAGGSSSDGSGVTPGGTSNAFYSAGIAVGGGGSQSGQNGKAVVVFNVSVQAQYKVAGVWKNINTLFYKVSGTWKLVTAGYYKVSGVWKALYNAGINFVETAAGFGNSNGNTTSGTAGSGPPIAQSGGCFIAGTMITMADGSFKAVEQVDIRDEVAVGGFVFATGKFLIEDLFEYKGIKVSGTHMVKEDGTWTRVSDSKHGKSLGDDEHIVYVFGSEFRRIIINGIEFTDYFEIDEKQKLLSIGEKFFGIWQDHDRQTLVDDVTILNNDR
jgi:hypothetical protein|tara:strand:+ start:879 stop:2327 length:1449 start_codon:yes stop_codon:yes gene_type:complete